MYVDDLMKSVADTDEAMKLVRQLREMLMGAGFRLTKLVSNDRRVLADIPECERAKSVVNLDIEDLPTENALGLKWNVEHDQFIWEILDKIMLLVKQKPVTRRGILSVICSLFDPLGFIAPYTMKAKLLLQMLCRKKLGWDSHIGEQDEAQWLRWLEDLPRLQHIQIDRCFKPKGFDEIKNTQLHIFSDGSRVGYGAVAYLRLVDVNNTIHCTFVMGKARLAPIHEITIPKLELTAAVISVRLNKMIQEELDIDVNQVFYWTDSTSVLKCIKNDSKRFHTFESNRLTIIRSASEIKEWRYVSGRENPADDAARGLKLEEMLKNDRWLKGPGFLWKEESCWPPTTVIPDLTDEDPEVRKEAQIYTVAAERNGLEDCIHQYSSWWKLKRAIAWLLRYKQFLLLKVCVQKRLSSRSDGAVQESEKTDIKAVETGYLKVDELRKAEVEIIRYVQKSAFPEVLGILTASEGDTSSKQNHRRAIQKAGTSIYKLNPVLKDGLLVVGGRIGCSSVDDELKYPKILPCKHHVTYLIVNQHHEDVGHMGQELVLSSLRKRFWIVKGRTVVRRVIRRCVNCQKRKAQPCEQFMADLPRERVTPERPPFTFVGVDYFGPLQVKQGRKHVKRYGCIFTCLTVRAVHIEIAHSLNTDSMINALRRFISLRGYPELIRSDCGTNFTRADKELKVAVDEWNQQRINEFCIQRGIQWIFNPPGASHMGGAWERMIRSVRNILKALLQEQIVSDEVLSTVIAEATSILNSRPLTRCSEDPSDDDPLTPNHLLQLRPCPCLPPGIFNKDDLHSRRQWRQAQYLSDVFWKRWSCEYLPTLQLRQKWNEVKKNLKVGDLVLLVDGNFPRGQWPMARVVEVNQGRDGLIRTAKVRTSSTVVTRAKRRRRRDVKSSTTILVRPVTKLCRLEMDAS